MPLSTNPSPGICCSATAERLFSSSPSSYASSHASTVAKLRKRHDPYARKQVEAKRLAHLSRQEVLRKERSKALGDPVRGITTPFVASFDTTTLPPQQSSSSGAETQYPGNVPTTDYLNYFLSNTEFRNSIKHSELLSEPVIKADRTAVDPEMEDEDRKRRITEHQIASAAIARIVSLENSSSKDRTRINIQRCIETFGRHNTDQHLRPKPRSTIPRWSQFSDQGDLEKAPRAGPDTGSSEVQAAILTAKIRTLANFLEGRGRKDKVNKRNLRLLVHKRQKHLAYLRKKERGGERWQNLIQTLGLTEGTWQGEISL